MTSRSSSVRCLGEITYVDRDHPRLPAARPRTIPQAICLHEEDAGVLWKHVDEDGAEVRRLRRMVISFHVTVANYEYLTYWRLYEDGNIECEVRATGIMGHEPVRGGGGTAAVWHGRRPAHVRADPPALPRRAARSRRRRAGEHGAHDRDAAGARGPDNPHGMGLTQVSTPLRTELEGVQDYDWSTQRAWKVVNPGVTNAHGTPAGYKLVPGAAFRRCSRGIRRSCSAPA